MDYNIKNYLKRPPLPGRKHTQLKIQSLEDLLQNRENYLLPKIDRFLQINSQSIDKSAPSNTSIPHLHKEASCDMLPQKRYHRGLLSEETIIPQHNQSFRDTSYSNVARNDTNPNRLQNKVQSQCKTPVVNTSVRSQGKNMSIYSDDESAAEGGSERVTPRVSAKSWVVYQMKKKKYIHGKRIFKKREVASLTKIMNLATVLDTLNRFGLDPKRIYIQIGPEAEQMSGTSALLKKGMIMSVYDLMFGMMLPSGNDAALILSQAIGTILCMDTKGKVDTTLLYNEPEFTKLVNNKRNSSVTVFLSQMNRKAKSIGMFNSNFANVHGLSQTNNLSSAEDIAKLCSYCMNEYELMRRVVSTKTYKVNYEIDCEVQFQQVDFTGEVVKITEIQRKKESMIWQNTNKLLIHENWSGIKTGITPNAGPCLAASINKVIGGMEYSFVVVLLSSVSMQARWKEAKSIVNWVLSQKLY